MNKQIIDAAALEIAKHYASKIEAAGMMPTREELAASIEANWEKISSEIAQVATAAASL